MTESFGVLKCQGACRSTGFWLVLCLMVNDGVCIFPTLPKQLLHGCEYRERLPRDSLGPCMLMGPSERMYHCPLSEWFKINKIENIRIVKLRSLVQWFHVHRHIL